MDMAVGDIEKPLTVDVHTHFFPAGLGDLAATTGDSRWPSLHVADDGQARIMRGAEVFRPVAQTCWDPVRRVDAMDDAGIDVHVLSPVPVMLTTWAETSLAVDFARRQNEALAAAAATNRSRYRWLGAVPLQDTDAAIAELERGTTELGMSGVQIGTEVDGRELDDASLRAFFVAADALGVAVFIHPTDGVGAIRRKGPPHEFGLGMLTDTAMAAGALLFGGVLDQCPQLRVGLAHGCGSFPWAFPRLARGATMAPGGAGFEARMAHSEELLKRLWADTLVFDPQHLALLMSRFGPEHLFLGSDFPFYPPAWGGPTEVIDDAVGHGWCDAAQANDMKGVNGLRFLGIDPVTLDRGSSATVLTR